jgi:hypothetical protein
MKRHSKVCSCNSLNNIIFVNTNVWETLLSLLEVRMSISEAAACGIQRGRDTHSRSVFRKSWLFSSACKNQRTNVIFRRALTLSGETIPIGILLQEILHGHKSIVCLYGIKVMINIFIRRIVDYKFFVEKQFNNSGNI